MGRATVTNEHKLCKCPLPVVMQIFVGYWVPARGQAGSFDTVTFYSS